MPSSLWILRLSACINSDPPKPPLGLRKPIQHFLFVTLYFSLLYFLKNLSWGTVGWIGKGQGGYNHWNPPITYYLRKGDPSLPLLASFPLKLVA